MNLQSIIIGKNAKKIIKLVILFSWVWSYQALATPSSESMWNDIESTGSIANTNSLASKGQLFNSSKKLTKFRSIALNEGLFKQVVLQAPKLQHETQSKSTLNTNQIIINVPLPNGDLVNVSLNETQVMSSELARKFPQIKTWKATGVNLKGLTGRVELTHYGFHAMLIMPDGDTVFVERDKRHIAGIYNSFSKQENKTNFESNFQCQLHDSQFNNNDNSKGLKRVAARAASNLIKYRLAMATTGEYTQYHGGKNNAMSAIATTINRVNQINERDLAITFELIDDQDLLIQTSTSDGYTNDDAQALIDENILKLRQIIGDSAYDIGHVFSQGSESGLARLGSVCSESLTRGHKASGVTGSSNPRGDAFNIDFVAHELGHQLGATHTFNSETASCSGENRTGLSAVEPGSGSTVMAYAGICGRNDLQAHSDAAYHIRSIEQIYRYTRFNNTGNSCGARSSVSNSEPVPNAGGDISIPANTPFVLMGSATDSDTSQSLTYSWEQNDNGSASDLNIDTGDNAIIRSRLPSTSNKRYIPLLSDLFDNRTVPGVKLPIADRDLSFYLTVRDGQGGFDWDDMKVQVKGTGRSFQVLSHRTGIELEIGQNTTVNWDVAGTASAPISCNAVDISLLESNGKQQQLKRQTSNDGSELVLIPNNTLGTRSARIMVACSGSTSTFFNVSSGDIRIVAVGQGGGGGDSSSGGGGGSLDINSMMFMLLLGFMGVASRRIQAKRVNVCQKQSANIWGNK